MLCLDNAAKGTNNEYIANWWSTDRINRFTLSNKWHCKITNFRPRETHFRTFDLKLVCTTYIYYIILDFRTFSDLIYTITTQWNWTFSKQKGIDKLHMLWLPWATRTKVWHKMAVWTATRAGWSSKRPFCRIPLCVAQGNQSIRNSSIKEARYTMGQNFPLKFCGFSFVEAKLWTWSFQIKNENKGSQCSFFP